MKKRLLIITIISLLMAGCVTSPPTGQRLGTFTGIPISSLPDNTASITTSDLVPMVNGGVTKQAPISAIIGLGGSGTLSGTGTQYYMPYWTGPHALGSAAPGTSGYVWTSNGASAYPSWQASTGGSSITSYSDVVALFGSGACSGFLKNDGTCVPLVTMAYPGAGIPLSVGGTSWGSSYTAGQGVGNLWIVPTSPGIHAIWVWDNTDGSVKPVVIGANLAYDHATHTLSAAASPGMTNPMTQIGDIVIGSIGGAPTTYADVAAGQPFLSGGVAAAPAYAGWYFSGTAAQTYTFPSTSKTLMATDYSNAGTTPTWNQDTTGSAVYWKTSGTGKMSVTGPATGTTRVKTYTDSNDTVLELSGSYTPTGTWNIGSMTFASAPWITSASISDTAYNSSTWGSATTVAPSKHAIQVYLDSKFPTGTDGAYGLILGNNTSTWTPGASSYGLGFVAGVPKLDINNTQYSLFYGALPGTLTDGKVCTYTSSGTLISCTSTLPTKAAYTDINTGSDDIKFATSLALKTSYVGIKDVGWAIIDSDTVTAVAEGKKAYVVPASLNGMNVIGFTCSVYNLNSATGGATTAQLRRSRAGTDADVLSSALSIAYGAYTASGSINTSYDDLVTGDMLFVDIDSVTTGAAQKGFACTMTAQLP